MTKEGTSQEFRLKKVIEIWNYSIKEMGQGELMINKNKKVCTTLDYTERFITLFFSSTAQIYIIVFTSLVDISTGIMNSTKRLNICSIIARVK